MDFDGDMAAALHDAVRRGDWTLVDFADHAVLRSSSEAGVRRIEGAAAVRDHLSRPGPGEVLHWDARTYPAGAAISFEWRSTAGAHDRRRWYVRTGEGAGVLAIHSYAARPAAGTDDPDVPAEVVAALGDGARLVALDHGGNSGASLRAVETPQGRLVLKRIVPGGDWLARVTRDEGRTAALAERGVFGELADVLDTGIVAATRASDGAAYVAMRDVSAALLGDDRRLTRGEARRVLDAAAVMHRRYRGRPPAGTATLAARVGMSSPAVSEAERASPDLLPKQFELAWEAFADATRRDGADVAAEVLRTVADVGPLCEALGAAAPLTLLHGDLRDDNLGFGADGRVVLLDWDLATAGTPTVEFAWFLLHDAWRTDATHDELEADFRAAEGPDLAADELELGMLSGLVQYGWVLGHSAVVHPDPVETAWAREELAWWVPRVRRALESLGGAP